MGGISFSVDTGQLGIHDIGTYAPSEETSSPEDHDIIPEESEVDSQDTFKTPVILIILI